MPHGAAAAACVRVSVCVVVFLRDRRVCVRGLSFFFLPLRPALPTAVKCLRSVCQLGFARSCTHLKMNTEICKATKRRVCRCVFGRMEVSAVRSHTREREVVVLRCFQGGRKKDILLPRLC